MVQPTIRDVAKRAGVGVGTVSRVLNNSAQVAPETRELVLQAIAALGFKPNSSARHLPRKTRLSNIGVITQPFVHYEAFAERMRGMQMRLYELESKHELVLYSVGSLEHFDTQLTEIVQSTSVEGLIIIDLDLLDEQKQLLRAANMPFVGINHFRGQDWPCIGADDIEGGYLAARHLLEYGHRDIAYLGDEFTDRFHFTTSAERFEGFQKAMAEYGVPVNEAYVRLGYHDYDVAKTLCRDLLGQPKPPTAIFAMSDIQALACLDAARDLNIPVPDAVSIIGFDDIAVSYHVGLSTVRQHFNVGGRLAIEHLLALMDGQNPDLPILPPLEVIPRHTTRRLVG